MQTCIIDAIFKTYKTYKTYINMYYYKRVIDNNQQQKTNTVGERPFSSRA